MITSLPIFNLSDNDDDFEPIIGDIGVNLIIITIVSSSIVTAIFINAGIVGLAMNSFFHLITLGIGLTLAFLWGGLDTSEVEMEFTAYIKVSAGILLLIIVGFIAVLLTPTGSTQTAQLLGESLLRYSNLLPFDLVERTIEVPIEYIALFVFNAAITEEALFRGGIYGTLRNRHGIWQAMLWANMAFMVNHFGVYGTQPMLLIVIIIGSVIMTIFYEWTQRWEVPAFMHASLNIVAILAI